MNIKMMILALQVKKGLTQSKIATALGCGQSTISSLVRGKHGVARPSNKIVDGLRKLLAENGLNPSVNTEKPDQTNPSNLLTRKD